jgi:hypothetical protein
MLLLSHKVDCDGATWPRDVMCCVVPCCAVLRYVGLIQLGYVAPC